MTQNTLYKEASMAIEKFGKQGQMENGTYYCIFPFGAGAFEGHGQSKEEAKANAMRQVVNEWESDTYYASESDVLLEAEDTIEHEGVITDGIDGVVCTFTWGDSEDPCRIKGHGATVAEAKADAVDQLIPVINGTA